MSPRARCGTVALAAALGACGDAGGRVEVVEAAGGSARLPEAGRARADLPTTPPDAGPPEARRTPDVERPPADARPTPDLGPPPADAAEAPRADAPLSDTAPDAATPDAGRIAGFSPAELAALDAMRRPDAPPPDPTNRYADDPAAARLGQRLFYAVDLSHNGLASCSGCHRPDRGFSGLLSYDGHGGLDFRSVPTLLDVSLHDWFFWDGRADTLWAQVRTPFESEDELDHDRVKLAWFVHDRAAVRADYEAAFGNLPDEAFWSRLPRRAKPSAEPAEAELDAAWAALSPDDRAIVDTLLARIGKAIAAYERRLLTGPAPFDAFLQALADAAPDAEARLDPAALRGLRLFVGPAGCVRCHSGPLLSDDGFHNIGLARLPEGPLDSGRAAGIAHVLADPFNAAGVHSDDPAGPRAQRLARLAVEPEDLGAFRTPTLRNVALTGPYLHDGRFDTLAEVLRYKTTLPDQPALGALDPALVPYPATEAEIAELVAFLNTLTAPPLDPTLTGPP